MTIRKAQPNAVIATPTVPVRESHPRPDAAAQDAPPREVLLPELDDVPVESAVIPLVEEHVEISKRQKVRGKLQVHVTTSEHQEVVNVPVSQQTTEVRRVPVGRVVDVAPEVRREGDTLIVPVVEEVLVLEKRLLLREEIHLVRHIETELREERVTLRSQRASVSRSEDEE